MNAIASQDNTKEEANSYLLATMTASDSDDDLPIAALLKKKRMEAKEAKNGKQKSNTGHVKRERTSSNSGSNRNNSSSSSNNNGGSANRNTATMFYEDCDKGMLVQRLLQRWWYVLEWPKKEDLAEVPPGYETLDGFLGVFISTRTDSLGNIIDLRNKETCPCLRNFKSYPCADLKKLCIDAYEKQMDILKEHEGDESALAIKLALHCGVF